MTFLPKKVCSNLNPRFLWHFTRNLVHFSCEQNLCRNPTIWSANAASSCQLIPRSRSKSANFLGLLITGRRSFSPAKALPKCKFWTIYWTLTLSLNAYSMLHTLHDHGNILPNLCVENSTFYVALIQNNFFHKRSKLTNISVLSKYKYFCILLTFVCTRFPKKMPQK